MLRNVPNYRHICHIPGIIATIQLLLSVALYRPGLAWQQTFSLSSHKHNVCIPAPFGFRSQFKHHVNHRVLWEFFNHSWISSHTIQSKRLKFWVGGIHCHRWCAATRFTMSCYILTNNWSLVKLNIDRTLSYLLSLASIFR